MSRSTRLKSFEFSGGLGLSPRSYAIYRRLTDIDVCVAAILLSAQRMDRGIETVHEPTHPPAHIPLFPTHDNPQRQPQAIAAVPEAQVRDIGVRQAQARVQEAHAVGAEPVVATEQSPLAPVISMPDYLASHPRLDPASPAESVATQQPLTDAQVLNMEDYLAAMRNVEEAHRQGQQEAS
jgi:hypothetical protein